MKETGFTLVELLVVISVMSILGLIFTGLLVQSLRDQKCVGSLNQIKQNGQVVLDRLSNEIRQAGKVVCVGVSGSGVVNNTIVTRRGEGENVLYTRYRLYSPSAGVNGFISKDDFTKDDFTDVDGIRVFSDNELCSATQTFDETKLTDEDVVRGVSLDVEGSSNVFAVNSKSGYDDFVTVSFRAYPPIGAGQTFESRCGGGLLFSTSIGLRGTL